MCKHGPIFPGRRQPSIFGTDQLNYRVRDGNGCTLAVRRTYLNSEDKFTENQIKNGKNVRKLKHLVY